MEKKQGRLDGFMPETRRVRLLTVSHLFKNPLEHSKLPHLEDLFKALSQEMDVEVIAPVPWYPPIRFPRRWYRFSQIPREHAYGDVRVRYPRQFVLPARILYFRAARSFLRTLRRTTSGEPYDVIWAHYAYPDGWAAVKLGAERGLPVIVTVRGEDVRSDVKHMGVRPLVEWTLAAADVVTSPHPETTELAQGLGREKVVELNNSLDVERFSSGDGRKIRQEVGLGDEFVVTFVAHLVEFRDPKSFVEAAAQVPTDEPIVFLMVGSAGRGREQVNLRGLAEDLGVRDRVKFLGDRGDIPDILAASDLFVSLSPYENIWNNALLEAMASGTACIVTQVGLTDQYLRHQKEAWLVPPRSPAQISEAIQRLRADPSLREELAQRAFSLVSAKFDLPMVRDQALNLLRGLAAKS
ncbi:MAG: glycosyltransferase [Thermoplasmata archaeon]